MHDTMLMRFMIPSQWLLREGAPIRRGAMPAAAQIKRSGYQDEGYSERMPGLCGTGRALVNRLRYATLVILNLPDCVATPSARGCGKKNRLNSV